jgi:alcohol dehydrogenase class IV
VLLPTALATNRKVCQVDFALLERAINPNGGGNDCVCADRFVERMTQLVGECGVVSRLSHLGLRADRIEWLAANSSGSSMNGNPVVLVPDELERILQDIY